ncbi:MAG TPA: AI-2E family transporter [Telluria sp.]|nr:AI-2E family transporter [Telluria sp.]
MEQRSRNYARITLILLLLVGCLTVLRPFLAAVLFAGAVTISSWPLYSLLQNRLRGRNTLAAAIMTLTLVLIVIMPLTLVAYNVADDVARFYEEIKTSLVNGELVPPSWLREVPVVGEWVDNYLRSLFHSREALVEMAQRLLEPARRILAGAAVVLGSGVAQVSLAVFVSFFLYRDGVAIQRAIGIAMSRLIGDTAPEVAGIVTRTVRGVMYGLLGTALAQAFVAAIGFTIAGVPAVPLLSVLTFLLSLIPVGPPLVWGGAAFWLFSHGETGWGIFMVLWGVFAISSVDNIVKPMLISRGSDLPFLLVLLGVLGGVLAFGFVGLFIGPTLLAVGFSLMRDWTRVNPEGPPLE